MFSPITLSYPLAKLLSVYNQPHAKTLRCLNDVRLEGMPLSCNQELAWEKTLSHSLDIAGMETISNPI